MTESAKGSITGAPSGEADAGTRGRRGDWFWRSVEGSIDPFQDTDRSVLPDTAWRFILYFANQAKLPFVLLLITGGLSGGVDAVMYWAVGWLIDLLGHSTPATLLGDHWPELAGLLILILVIRAAVMIAAVASWSRGADPVHSADDAGPFGAPEGEGIDALDATPLAEEWSPA